VIRFIRAVSLHLWFAAAMALVIGGALVLSSGVIEAPLASAATSAPTVAQCNADTFPTGAGFQVTCTVNVVNTVTDAGATSSTVTATACLAAAGVLAPFGCNTTVSRSSQLVTSVNQCNGIVGGGGSNVICNVTITNNVPSATTESGVTVYQCIGSDTGGGGSPIDCGPSDSTFSSTVNQCNSSSTGGGSSVTCSETGAAEALPVTILQCNGTANGGGSTVTCSSSIMDVFAAPTPPVTPPTTPPVTTPPVTTPPVTTPPVTTPPVTTPPGTTPPVAPVTSPTAPTGTTPGGTGASPLAGSGSSATSTGTGTGTSGAASATPSVVLPVGAPSTGLGGAARSGDNELMVVLGAALLFAAVVATGLAMRRRRDLIASSDTGIDEQ
jgi:hypothetical protein